MEIVLNIPCVSFALFQAHRQIQMPRFSFLVFSHQSPHQPALPLRNYRDIQVHDNVFNMPAKNPPSKSRTPGKQLGAKEARVPPSSFSSPDLSSNRRPTDCLDHTQPPEHVEGLDGNKYFRTCFCFLYKLSARLSLLLSLAFCFGVRVKSWKERYWETHLPSYLKLAELLCLLWVAHATPWLLLASHY